MKIGLVAMSGVRADDPELTAIGLTLPGFVERSEIIASLPSLGLLTLAALTPPEVEVEYVELPDLSAVDGLPGEFDLVAISSWSAQIADAYALSARYRAAGVPTVLGGWHVSVLPGEARAHADSIVIGDGEPLWPQVVADFAAGRLQPEYRLSAGRQYDLALSPVPRYELLDPARYNRLTVQTSRGCPHRCEFCGGGVVIDPHYRVKPVERIIAEVRRIREVWPHAFIEFADDNSFVHRGHARHLLHALRDEGVKWFTEVDVSIADDPELLDLMRESGCRQVLIGLESPTADGLWGLELKDNWKLRRQPDYEAAVRTIQDHGIKVDGCFILGLDGHDESVFEGISDFVDRTGLYDVQLTVLTPFPGTPLYARLEREGRLISPGAWSKCTLFDINFVPRAMSPERLRQGLIDLARHVYDKDGRSARQRAFVEHWLHRDERPAT